MLDCLIIGGGPAGLTAAIYLARLRRRVALVDGGSGRASLINCTRNVPGFPGGISGADLLKRLVQQAIRFNVVLKQYQVDSIVAEGDCFVTFGAGKSIASRSVLLATGVVDRMPQLPGLRTLIDQGLAHFCPVCDAYEIIGKTIAILGPRDRALEEAGFLRTFTNDITVLSCLASSSRTLSGESQNDLKTIRETLVELHAHDDRVLAVLASGRRVAFDAIYLAFGVTVCSKLAADVGAHLSGASCILVDSKQRTSIRGVYAAGDVVEGLDQIAVAVGQAAIAAVAIHNDLPTNPVEE
jgi:thioredoxin reductase (NADPH)